MSRQQESPERSAEQRSETPNRLDSWKEIAAYFGRDVRTVRRWEADQGLPVHRHVHRERGRVYGYPHELDSWLETRSQEPSKSAEAPGKTSDEKRVRQAGFAMGLVAAAALVAVFGFGFRSGDPEATVRVGPSEVRHLTSYPGTEAHPSFSPDGSQVVFTWRLTNELQTDLYVKVVGSGDPLKLTDTEEAEQSPNWSPDGKWIAFARVEEEAESELVVMPALGGAERIVARGSIPWDPDLHSLITWSLDSRYLFATFAEEKQTAHGLFVFDLDGAGRRQLTKTFGSAVDSAPALSQDGRTLVFSRLSSRGSSELFLVELDEELRPTGEPRRLTNYGEWTSGAFFAGDKGALFFLRGDPLRAAIWKMDLHEPKKAERVTWFQRNIRNVSFSPRARRLAYARVEYDQNIWRLELTDDGQVKSNEVVLDSTQSDANPDLSPHGALLVFASNRSGSSEIWVSAPDGSDTRQVTFLGNAMTGSPRWSPDGRRIVFDSRVDGKAELFVIRADGTGLERITETYDNEVLPTWSRDGRALYYGSDKGGRWQIWRLDLEERNPRQITINGGLHAVEAADGRYLYYTADDVSGEENALWRLPLAGEAEAERVMQPLYWYNTFTLAADGIFYIPKAVEGTVSSLRYRSWANSAERELVGIEPMAGFGMTVSADERRILFTRYDRSAEADLLFMDGFPAESDQPPPTD